MTAGTFSRLTWRNLRRIGVNALALDLDGAPYCITAEEQISRSVETRGVPGCLRDAETVDDLEALLEFYQLRLAPASAKGGAA